MGSTCPQNSLGLAILSMQTACRDPINGGTTDGFTHDNTRR